MVAWFETLGVVILACVGIALGLIFSRLRKSYWIWGFAFAFLLIGMLVTARFSSRIRFVAPFSWFALGRVRFIVLALAVTLGLTTPIARLGHKFERVALFTLMIVVVVWFSVFPFLVPALIEEDLSSMATQMDSDGICFQATNYTCGPAAAVTALTVFGLEAHEGEIAVLSHSNPFTGTLPSCLSSALERRYRDEGLKCDYRHFDSLEQLKSEQIALAVVKNGLLSDHCVVILKVTENFVTIADPSLGKKSIPRRSFETIWRFSGIVLQRDSAQPS
ncbi:cysteine peptidase family C39 domain-containing protein [Planctomycetota bacterium]